MTGSDSEQDKSNAHNANNPLGPVHDEVLHEEQVDEDGQNSVSGPSKACAKDWDVALLPDCSAPRLQLISKDYPGL